MGLEREQGASGRRFGIVSQIDPVSQSEVGAMSTGSAHVVLVDDVPVGKNMREGAFWSKLAISLITSRIRQGRT